MKAFFAVKATKVDQLLAVLEEKFSQDYTSSSSSSIRFEPSDCTDLGIDMPRNIRFEITVTAPGYTGLGIDIPCWDSVKNTRIHSRDSLKKALATPDIEELSMLTMFGEDRSRYTLPERLYIPALAYSKIRKRHIRDPGYMLACFVLKEENIAPLVSVLNKHLPVQGGYLLPVRPPEKADIGVPGHVYAGIVMAHSRDAIQQVLERPEIRDLFILVIFGKEHEKRCTIPPEMEDVGKSYDDLLQILNKTSY